MIVCHFRSAMLYSRMVISVALAIWGIGCANKAAQSPPNAEAYFQRGRKLMAKKDYVGAKEVFEKIISNFPGSDWVDDAQFQLAEAYFYSEDYVSAAFEYERIREDFPLSPLVDDAQFKLALCYFRESPRAELDQETTYKATEEFARFIQDYPQSPLVGKAQKRISEGRTKLAKKDYLNGKFYLNTGDYDAALIYFREVLNRFSDTKWAAHAQFGMGEALFRQNSYEDALQAYQRVTYGEASEPLKGKARKRITEIQKHQQTKK